MTVLMPRRGRPFGAGAMLVTPKLLGEFRIGAAGSVVGDRVAGVSGADQDDRRAPISLADKLTGEGVAEDRHQRPIRRDDRGTQVGAASRPIDPCGPGR